MQQFTVNNEGISLTINFFGNHLNSGKTCVTTG